jgi:hypothetical protein
LRERRRDGRVRAVVACTVPILAAVLGDSLRAQTFGSFFRGDEVGPSQLHFDEETFMNILSFEQPLESVQPFLAADSGWQAALGSLRSDLLWYEMDLKYHAPITEDLDARAFVHSGLDLDTDFTQVQVMPELAVADHLYLGIPVVLQANKGMMDGGFAATWRDPAEKIDFFQLEWVRSDALFNHKSDEMKKSEVVKPADNFELQGQADLFGFGKTTLILADETPNQIDFVENQHVDEFSRFTARALQAVEWADDQRVFLDLRYEIANEDSTPTGALGAPDEFHGDRDLFSARAEFQLDRDEEKIRRWRAGAECLFFHEDSQTPFDPKKDYQERRSEAMVYAGYRTPFYDSKQVDLETVVYLDRPNNVRRYPNDPSQDDHDPMFQGKISFYFRWHASDHAEFVLSPSFELDSIGWGGGAIMLRYRL